MTLIPPTSDVWLCRDIPFDPGYRFTGVYIAGGETQFNIISQKAFFHASRCTYIRQRSAIRLEIPISDCYNTNYLIYKNSFFENKYFYGFVTAIRYISNTVTEFDFTEDIMNTWTNDYITLPSFIERMHVSDDTPGKHIIPEGLETGDFIVATGQQLPVTKNKIYIAATFDKNLNNYYGGMQNNVYTGLCINEFNNAQEVGDFINRATSANKLDGIVQIFQAINYNSVSTLQITQDKNTLFEGYKPRNNKLYTYPYSFLQVLGNDGGNAIFKWEYADNFGTMPFNISISPSVGSQMMITPSAYQNVEGYNPLQRMIIENVMLCSWNGDTFKANLAQTIGAKAIIGEVAIETASRAPQQLADKITSDITDRIDEPRVTNFGESLALAGADALRWVGGAINDTKNWLNEALYGPSMSKSGVQQGLTKNVLSQIGKALEAVHQPEAIARQAQNPGGSTDILYMNGVKAPYFMQMGIRRDYAEIIDNYFDMFGYRVNKKMRVPRRTRDRYTYVKTMDCVVKGNLPAQIAHQIESIYNNGTTFWYLDGSYKYSLENVGSYGVNPPIEQG